MAIFALVFVKKSFETIQDLLRAFVNDFDRGGYDILAQSWNLSPQLLLCLRRLALVSIRSLRELDN